MKGVMCTLVIAALVGLSLANLEGDALNSWRQALTDPNNVLQSWDPTLVNPCTWFHVTCNANSSVIRIDLGNAGLSGVLLPLLGELLQLQYLMIFSNNISGTIPPELGNLTNLVTLDLSQNNLEGSIPMSIWLLGGLQTLDLSFNHFEDVDILPTTSVSLIQSINLSGNRLTTSIPPIFGNTQTLNLSYNLLDGLVPSFLWQQGPLRILDLSGNNLTDLDLPALPSYDESNPVAGSSLQQIYISNNHLSGPFPVHILMDFPNLQVVIADHNFYAGVLNVTNHSCRLQTLSLVHNNIDEVTPQAEYVSISTLLLGGNPVCQNNATQQSTAEQKICRYSNVIIKYVESVNGTHPSKRLVMVLSFSLSFVGLLASGVCGVILWRLQKKNVLLREIQREFAKQQVQPSLYSFNEIKLATKNFHPDNKLGEGGFGVVFKGTLSDGTDLAIKRLSNCRQGVGDFLNEVILITGIKHRNLVTLKGCCLKENQRILVYELVENKDLAKALWGLNDGFVLNWPTRFNICVGIARGLTYLHEDSQPRIIHRDIKAPNILLDKELKAKIADFGLARLFPDEQSHLSTMHIAGTMGYMAPEYATRGQLTEKADVYSFGVLVLEVVSGRKNIDFSSSPEEIYLLEWAWNRYEEDRLLDLVDNKLSGDEVSIREVRRVITVALLCIQSGAARRPSMSTVLAMLLGEREMEVVFRETEISSTDRANFLTRAQGSTLTTLSEESPLLQDSAPQSRCSNVLELSDMQQPR